MDKYRNDLLALERKLGLSPSGPKTSIADMEKVIGAFLNSAGDWGGSAKAAGQTTGRT